MTKEQLANIIIASEDTMYHVAKTLLRSDADCVNAIQEALGHLSNNIQHFLSRKTYYFPVSYNCQLTKP